MLRLLLPCLLVASTVFLPAGAPEPQDAAQVELRVEELSARLAVLEGQGGNIAIYHGDDGVLLVDDQFAHLSEAILAKVEELTGRAPRFVVNTHWHRDHTQGNAAMAAAGATLVAHENVRARLSTDQVMPALDRTVEASPDEALPVITFDDGLSLHLNGGRVDVIHVDPAHTDGDALVHFVDENVLHTGDVFFHGMLPFIDIASGGSVDGMIDGVQRALALCDDDTRIVPGHGPVATRADLEAYLALLVDVHARVLSRLQAGLTVEELQKLTPLSDLEAQYGGGFLSVERFTGIVASSIQRELERAEHEAR